MVNRLCDRRAVAGTIPGSSNVESGLILDTPGFVNNISLVMANDMFFPGGVLFDLFCLDCEFEMLSGVDVL
jgi:hypothetical protein